MARICFVELPARDLPAAKSFYRSAFGWELTEFGPTYACTMTGDVDVGLQGDMTEATRAPLAVIAVDDLEAAQAAVEQAGGVITPAVSLHRSERAGAGGAESGLAFPRTFQDRRTHDRRRLGPTSAEVFRSWFQAARDLA